MLKNKRLLWLSLILLTVSFSGICDKAYAQQADSLDIEDPFENDPFFSRPIDDMLNRPPKDWVQPDEVRKRIHYMNQAGLDYGDSFENGPFMNNPVYGLYPVLPMIHYNRVNGGFLGVKKERMTWDDHDDFLGIEAITPHGMIGYSFGLEEWQYSFGIEKYFGNKSRFVLGSEYYSGTSTDDYWRVGLNETSLSALFAGYDFLDYYHQEGYGIYGMFRTPVYIDLGLSFNATEYSSLSQQTDYSFFGKQNTYRINPPVTEGDFESVSLGIMFNRRNVIMSQFFSMQGWALAELSNEFGLKADQPYNRYEGALHLYFYLQKGTMLKWRIRAGSATGEVPLQKQFELGGIGTMRATPFKMMKGNAMALSNLELHMGSSNVMGDMEWLDADDLTLSLFIDSGWTKWEQDLKTSKSPLDGFQAFNFEDLQHDAGIGIGTNLFRAELAWPIDSIGNGRPALWFRFNPTF